MNMPSLNHINKPRKVSLDVIKIISAFMVIMYHMNILEVGFNSNQYYFPNINKMCLCFCAMSVPLFFMVNGSLILNRENPFKYHLKKATKSAFLYVFWLVAIKVAVKLISSRVPLKNDLSYELTSHLWFLGTITVLYALSYFIKRIYKNKILIIIICVCLFLIPFTYNYIVVFSKFLHIPFFESLPRTGMFTMYSILYFIFGKNLSDRLEYLYSKKFYIFIECASILVGWLLVNAEVIVMTNYDKRVFDGVNASFPTIGALLMALGAFSLLNRITAVRSNKVNFIINFLSRNIMGIYLIHPIIIRCAKHFITVKIDILPAVVLAITIMAVCALITELLQKIPLINKLFII